jgi:hypothetical protein
MPLWLETTHLTAPRVPFTTATGSEPGVSSTHMTSISQPAAANSTNMSLKALIRLHVGCPSIAVTIALGIWHIRRRGRLAANHRRQSLELGAAVRKSAPQTLDLADHLTTEDYQFCETRGAIVVECISTVRVMAGIANLDRSKLKEKGYGVSQ